MREISQFEMDCVSAAAGTAGAPLASGDDLVEGGRAIGDFVSGFLQAFYDAF